MATLQSQLYLLPSNSLRRRLHFRVPCSIPLPNSKNFLFTKKVNGNFRSRFWGYRSTKGGSAVDVEQGDCVVDRPPFDINLAVILAGFAFEAYTTPPEKVGEREIDASSCQTVFLSESFVREIYDGQLFVKLKKGFNFPALDPWGSSDPYVIMQLDCQEVRSKVKWGTTNPTWNEEFALNIKQPPMHNLQVAAWDANLVTPHKRMGNTGIVLDNLCDGNSHDLQLELEGMGGGGKIEIEIKYKSFSKIDDEKKWWKFPFVGEFLQKNGFEPALKMIAGSETVQARQFVEFAFGQLKSLNDSYLQKDWLLSNRLFGDPDSGKNGTPDQEVGYEVSANQLNQNNDINKVDVVNGESLQSDTDFWKKLSDSVGEKVVQKLGLPAPEVIKWDRFDLLNNIGLQSQKIADAIYVETGLAIPKKKEETSGDALSNSGLINETNTSVTDIKKVTRDLLQQTDSILSALMVINASISKLSRGENILGNFDAKTDASVEAKMGISEDKENNAVNSQSCEFLLDEKKAEEMKELFSTAESAMEAWAILANALGHPSFIKSEFEKICFLDNDSTDTQVALWRDPYRKRLVISFRGTEQTRWKDLRTDLMLVPVGLNPERIGGDFKQEIQVHSGFLSAYDSVRTRLIALIKQAIGYRGEPLEMLSKWHLYVTGHSLGGALATLLALELSSSQLAKNGAISVTMYNFGSPRVGNRRFAEAYNKNVKDSWRVVNHRDIIPTVPRLMGYCHVAQPVYLTTGDLRNAMENLDLLEDGYSGDVIGEATPDVLVNEFLKGERELLEKILSTEINFFSSIRDGSALMQHMEDFYYITLLENVRSNYRTVSGTEALAVRKQSVRNDEYNVTQKNV